MLNPFHHDHDHIQTVGDSSLLDSKKGIGTVKLSFMGLLLTAVFQAVVVIFSGSIALLADTIHNIGDAVTAIPLWVAFTVAQWKPNKRFTYGYGRVEDFAGIAIVLIILFSAVFAGYESVNRLLHPQKIEHLWAVAIASIVGFIGNEAVALFRIKVGKEIGSVALIADGHHARIDGLTSLAVLCGAIGVWLGFPLSDTIVGLIITVVIFMIVWDSIKAVFLRVLDEIDPEMVDEIRHVTQHVPKVKELTEVRIRWIGHRLHAELNASVDSNLTVEQGHETAKEIRHQLLHHLKYLSNVTVHVDPVDKSGEKYHVIERHTHDSLPVHSHE